MCKLTKNFPIGQGLLDFQDSGGLFNKAKRRWKFRGVETPVTGAMST